MAKKTLKTLPKSTYVRLVGEWCKGTTANDLMYFDRANPVTLIGQNGYWGYVDRAFLGELRVFVVTTGPRKGVWANAADLGR